MRVEMKQRLAIVLIVLLLVGGATYEDLRLRKEISRLREEQSVLEFFQTQMSDHQDTQDENLEDGLDLVTEQIRGVDQRLTLFIADLEQGYLE